MSADRQSIIKIDSFRQSDVTQDPFGLVTWSVIRVTPTTPSP